MAPAEELLAEPVIASSNRYLDIEPYTKKLFVEDPKTWAQIFPWEFPQNGTREQEEEFLRRFFTEREIRMQGGADGDGNGFRFLKQVWYSAALWNLNYRLPAVVDQWFEQNADLLSDPAMKEHMLRPDVQVGTFFDAEQMEMYGADLLHWAVKQIQFRVSPPPVLEELDVSSAVVDSTPLESSKQEINTQAKKPVRLKLDQTSPEKAEQLPTSPAVHALSATKSQNDDLTPLTPFTASITSKAAQARRVSDEAKRSSAQHFQPIEHRQRRGSLGGKRASFIQDRQNQRPTFNDARVDPHPHVPHVAQNGYGASMPPSEFMQNRVPSGGLAPGMVDQMPTLPQGQQVEAPPSHLSTVPMLPYGQQFQPGHHFVQAGNGYPPESFPPGLSSGPHGTVHHPFNEHNNVQSSGRYFAHQQSFGFEDRPDYAARPGGDSMNARGGKTRGYGSVRGRGSRGRNSFGQSSIHGGYASQRNQSGDHGQPDPSFTFRERGQNIQQQTYWRAPGHNENGMPRAGPFSNDARLHAPGYGVQNPTFYRDSGRDPGQANVDFPPPASFQGRGHDSKPATMNKTCDAGCTTERIADGCTTATRLIVFAVPPDMPQPVLWNFFYQFGAVKHISKPSWNPSGPVRPHVFVTFANVAAARACMAHKNMSWPGGEKLMTEVANGHLDSYNERHRSLPHHQNQNQVAGAAQTWSQTTNEAPMQQTAHASDPNVSSSRATRRLPERQSSLLTDEATSTGTTPTPSVSNTPKNGKGQKKKGKKVGTRNDKVEPVMDEAEPQSRQDSILNAAATRVRDDVMVAAVPDQGPAATPPQPAAQTDSMPLSVANTGQETTDAPGTTTNPDPQEHDLKKPEEVAGTGPDVIEDRSFQERPNGKTEEDHVDDSFHTATGSPKSDQQPTQLPAMKESPKVLVESSSPLERPDISHLVRNEAVELPDGTKDDINSTSAEPLRGLQEDQMTPLPNVPKARKVSINLPPMDVRAASDLGRAVLEGDSQVSQQRSVSGTSDAPNSAFITAPSTPAEPLTPAQTASKKAQKQKGAAQTESLSIFGKSIEKKPKKPKVAKGKGSLKSKPKMEDHGSPVAGNEASSRVASGTTTPMPQPIEPTMEDNVSQPTEHGNIHQETSQDEPVPAQAQEEQALQGALHSCKSDDESGQPQSEPQPPTVSLSRRPTISRVLGLIGIGASPAPEVEQTQAQDKVDMQNGQLSSVSPEPETQEATPSKAANVEDLAESGLGQPELATKPEISSVQVELDDKQDAMGLGISATLPAAEVAPTKKKTKKQQKSKPKKADAIATAQNIAMPCTDEQGSEHLFQYMGNEADSDKSTNTPANSNSSSASGSSPGKKIAAEKDKPKHLVEARPPRRKPKRATSRGSSNTLSSALNEEATAGSTKSSALTITGDNSVVNLNAAIGPESIVTPPNGMVLLLVKTSGDDGEQEETSPQPQPAGRVIEEIVETDEDTSEEVKKSKAKLFELSKLEEEKRAAASKAEGKIA